MDLSGMPAASLRPNAARAGGPGSTTATDPRLTQRPDGTGDLARGGRGQRRPKAPRRKGRPASRCSTPAKLASRSGSWGPRRRPRRWRGSRMASGMEPARLPSPLGAGPSRVAPAAGCPPVRQAVRQPCGGTPIAPAGLPPAETQAGEPRPWLPPRTTMSSAAHRSGQPRQRGTELPHRPGPTTPRPASHRGSAPRPAPGCACPSPPSRLSRDAARPWGRPRRPETGHETRRRRPHGRGDRPAP